jgi:Predicted integral membrane protein (DUF2269)
MIAITPSSRASSARMTSHVVTDFIFTAGGVVLILIGAYGMVWTGGLDPVHTTWLLWGQGLFIASGLIWVAILIPIQIRQARMARGLPEAKQSLSAIGGSVGNGRSGAPSPRCSRSPISISRCSSRRNTRRGTCPNKAPCTGPSCCEPPCEGAAARNFKRCKESREGVKFAVMTPPNIWVA